MLQSADEDIEVYAYGAEIFLGAVLKLIILLIIASFFGMLKPLALVCGGLFGFRIFGGGSHLKTYARCLTFGVVVIIGLSGLSTIAIKQEAVAGLLLLTFVFALWVIMKYVPTGIQKKRMSNLKQIFDQKNKSVVFLLFWFVVSLSLIFNNRVNLSFALVLGGSFGIVSITAWGFIMTLGIDHAIDKLERRLKK